MISQINSIDDVRTLVKDIVKEGVNFHPDDDFRNYMCYNNGVIEPFFTEEEAEFRNNLVTQCFEVCDREGVEVYEVALEVFLTEAKPGEFFPLTSQV